MSRAVHPGAELSRARSARRIARHYHVSPYAAVVLRGGYVEAGDRGRFRAAAGDVLFHDGFEAHQDRFGRSGADILNIPLRASPGFAFARVDVDSVMREAERDLEGAASFVCERSIQARGDLSDWPDMLAADLAAERVPGLRFWASELGLCPSSVSRGFRLCYGVSPQRFRLELRAARAARAAVAGGASLARIAAESDFADQPHMSRTVRALYGRSPSRLCRRRDNCVQD